jgi:gas vesicle structural protein
MAMMAPPVASARRGGGPSGLADVLDVLLDKGLVIDAFVRVSLIGIELLTIDARIVVASVDTYLRFAEAVNRLDLTAVGDHATIQDIGRQGAEQKTRGAIEGAKDALGFGKDKDKDKEREDEKVEARSK